MQNKIAIPTPTRERLEKLISDRQTLQALIDTTVQTVREALVVPEDWILANLADGFTAPAKPPPVSK